MNRVISDNVTYPTGQFCCNVPDENDVCQILCANIQSELTTSKSQNVKCTLTYYCAHIRAHSHIATGASSILYENLSGGESGHFSYIIGGSIAGAVAVSVIITIPVTVVIFVLVLHYCRKRRQELLYCRTI